jgi:hypothetical protein
MSSHREAPQISQDPVADSADLYAFMSPDRPGYVTIIANYVPLQSPDGGPNFYEFGEDIHYDINIDNNGDALPEITYRFQFKTVVENPASFLYNGGPITSLTSKNWNRKQHFSVTKVVAGSVGVLIGDQLASPPCNIGPLSTPDYPSLAQDAVHTLATGETVFCGQRADGFYVDLGAIFDLANLRPFQELNVFSPFHKGAPGRQSLKAINVHSIALQVPVGEVAAGSTAPVIGVWTAAHRQQVRLRDEVSGSEDRIGPWVQVSRLGDPLINEVIIPMGLKDTWNGTQPSMDSNFAQYYAHPELADLLPILYHAPGSTSTLFPNLAALNKSGTARADLEAALLTGIPPGLVAGFQNYTGPTQSDMLRLNTSISPSSSPSNLGVLGGDLAGYPNGLVARCRRGAVSARRQLLHA